MGVNLVTRADLPRKGLLRRFESGESAFTRTGQALADSLGGHPLSSFCRLELVEPNHAVFHLYPSEEPLFLEIVRGLLIVSAKTSSAGPGYHAFLVDLLDEIQTPLGFEWNWKVEEGYPGDETGYVNHRDYAKLQAAHVDWLQALAASVLDSDQGQTSICMPLHFRIEGNYYAATPRGYLARDDIQALRSGRPEVAASFFPWWDRERNPRFFDGLSDVLCWTALPWRPPFDSRERQLYQATAKVLARCTSSPEHELTEIERLLEHADEPLPVEKEGRGYLRHPVRLPLVAGWSVVAPGYFLLSWEEGTWNATYDQRSIHITTFTAEGQGGADLLAAYLPDSDPVCSHADHGLQYSGLFEGSDEDRRTILRGAVATEGQLASVTVTFSAPEHRAWALQVLRSLRFQG